MNTFLTEQNLGTIRQYYANILYTPRSTTPTNINKSRHSPVASHSRASYWNRTDWQRSHSSCLHSAPGAATAICEWESWLVNSWSCQLQQWQTLCQPQRNKFLISVYNDKPFYPLYLTLVNLCTVLCILSNWLMLYY